MVFFVAGLAAFGTGLALLTNYQGCAEITFAALTRVVPVSKSAGPANLRIVGGFGVVTGAMLFVPEAVAFLAG